MSTESTEYTTSAGDIADAIVSHLASGKRIETTKLHILLYLVQGWHLVSFDEPAFTDLIEARMFGPFVPAVAQYHGPTTLVGEYNNFGGRGLASLNATRYTTVEYVLANYNSVDTHALQRYIRALKSPWDITYGEHGDYATIEQSLIADCFAAEQARVLAGSKFMS
jgi:uncharacterized phage-associated protein